MIRNSFVYAPFIEQKGIRLAPTRTVMAWIVMALDYGTKPTEQEILSSISRMEDLFEALRIECEISRIEQGVIRVECPHRPTSFGIGLTAGAIGGDGWYWVPTTSSSDGFKKDKENYHNYTQRDYLYIEMFDD